MPYSSAILVVCSKPPAFAQRFSLVAAYGDVCIPNINGKQHRKIIPQGIT
jgi:hypothetical protein